MNSKRSNYFKTYVNNSEKDQDPKAGTSKANNSKPTVVRKLTFQTPRKQKNALKNSKTTLTNRNKPKQKIKLSDSVVLSNANVETVPLFYGNKQICDLTDENNESSQKEDFTDREEDTLIQKELEIFKEIERLHEIEEACDQIRQEHSDNCIDQCEMMTNDDWSKSAINLECLEDYKEIEIDLNESCNVGDSQKISQIDKNDQFVSSIEPKKIKNENGDVTPENKGIKSTISAENDSKLIPLPSKNDTLKDIKKMISNMEETEENQIDKGKNNDIAHKIACKSPEKKRAKTNSCAENDTKLITIPPDVDKINNELKGNDTDIEIKENKQIDNANKSNTLNNDIIKSYITEENNNIESMILISPKLDENNEDMNDDLNKDLCNNEPDLNKKQSKIINIDKSGHCSYEKDENQINKETKRDTYLKNKHLRQQKRQKYVDFLSDNEDFVWSSSSWEESNESESSESEVGKKRIKKKNQKNVTKLAANSTNDGRMNKISEAGCSASVVAEKKKRKNIRKETKIKRETGQEYSTKKGKIIPAKEIKPNPCSSSNCTNKCYEVSEERRKALFSHFWNLDSIRRKDWLVSHSKKLPIKRHRSSDLTKRTNTFIYSINEGEGQRKVCQQFMTCTLDIKQKTLYNIVKNSYQGSASEDMRGKHVPSNKTPNSVIENLRKYIQELPALPSHYCRKNSKRTYLPQEFKNITNLYRIYKETMEKNGSQYVGDRVFKKVFTTDFNIGFHFPRKDKCLKCTQFENDKNINEDEKQKHLIDKEETNERFKAHQEIHNKDDTILCTTFDLQKVLNTPHGENMMLYYSRKLAVYNLTFYESGTRNGFCYTWSEIDGKRGANEVASILQKYINKVDQLGTIKHLLLYCDSCPGQNKNKIVLACINETLQNCNSLLSIQINYLLPGHTYMPVDSIHSVIERSLNGVIIWAPSQWSTVFTLARKSPKPYEVEVLTYTDFYKWDLIADKYFKGNLVGKMSKLRTVTFRKSAENKAFVKFSMNPDAKSELIEITKKKNAVQLKSCYKELLPVSKKKYMDLNKLCTNKVIPPVYHEEYKRLNYSNNNVEDYLIDTDIEDEEYAE